MWSRVQGSAIGPTSTLIFPWCNPLQALSPAPLSTVLPTLWHRPPCWAPQQPAQRHSHQQAHPIPLLRLLLLLEPLGMQQWWR